MAKVNLNDAGISYNYKRADKNKQSHLSLTEIYSTFLNSKEIDRPVLTMLEINVILRNQKKSKIIAHPQGTKYYANEVFFSERKNSDGSYENSDNFKNRIIDILKQYNIDKKQTGAKIAGAKAKIENRFGNKIKDLFEKSSGNNYNKKKFISELSKNMREYRFDIERLEMLNILNNYKYLLKDNFDATRYINDKTKYRIELYNANKFANLFSFNKEIRTQLVNNLDKYKLSLGVLAGSRTKELKDAFDDIIREGYNSKEIENTINKAHSRDKDKNDKVTESAYKYNNRVRTLSRTLAHGIDNLINFNEADKAGITKYKYVGNPVPQRPFCIAHYGHTYTKEQINYMTIKNENGQGLDVMSYCGGYNCLHMWIPVE